MPMVVYTEGETTPAPTGSSFGYLKINVAVAQRALPVSDAQVMVYENIEENQQDLLAVLQTNASGETEMISLPSPDLEESQHPPESDTSDDAYRVYYVRIVAANFVTRDRLPVQIFPGIVSDLVVNMQAPVYIG